MKKKYGNKKYVYATLASMMLLCSACGAQDGTQSSDGSAKENIQDSNLAADMADSSNNNDATGNSAASSVEDGSGNANNAANNTESNNSDNNSADSNSTDSHNGNDNSNADESMNNSENPARISITFETIENNDTAEDGTSIYTSAISYPVVSIEGNAAAAEKINADIKARVDAFQADTLTLDAARENYQLEAALGSEYPFPGYYSDMGFTVARSDNNVISFTGSFSNYSGGAHGNYNSFGINYNTKSGERISFSELGKDPETFYADTLTFNKELAATQSYQERMFGNSIEDLETVLYADEKWYLSTDGLVFISNPYELGPYVSGMIEFIIPYADLEAMGLDEEYLYTGNPEDTASGICSYPTADASVPAP